MAGINPHVPLHLAQVAIFTGKGFRNAEDYARYLIKFQDRPLCPSISLDPARFNRYYDMNIPGLINAVGWSNLPLDQCYSFRPEAVRMFYANMQPCFNADPPTFTTVVYNYLLTISIDILSYLLGYPIAGTEVLDEDTSRKLVSMKLKPFVSTQEIQVNIILLSLPLDVSLMISKCSISSLLGSSSPALMDSIGSTLWICGFWLVPKKIAPLAILISCIDLRYKVARVDLIDTLRAQFVLHKVNAFVGRKRPRVNASGGEGTVVPAAPLVADPVDEAVHEEPVAAENFEDGLSTAELEEELGGDEGEISDYLSSQTFPF
ncbi:unnamed protein product [Linum trigynum]|uniref:Uncharacterized protein n=1 Tax=Linum trigynum TaxID=586398 RepID=A0AAV2EQI3_9ROSI